MSVEIARERAARLRVEAASSPFGDLAAPPADVETIAAELAGLLLVADDLHGHADRYGLPAGTQLSGLLLPDRAHLVYDQTEASQSSGRRRFTIAHELGHWYVHHEAGSTEARFCRAQDTTPGVRASGALEREANAFAAELLMPAAPLGAEVDRLRCNVGLLAREFGVSEMAMRVRLTELELLPSYMR